MVQHRDLTGASLHEPKGVETASAGQVYRANGSGSGTWVDPLSSILNLNSFAAVAKINDISTAGDRAYVAVPAKSNLIKVFLVEHAAITVGNATLTIYKNGIAQTPNITVPFSGSGAGVTLSSLLATPLALLEGDVLEVRTAGGSTGVCPVSLSFKFTAT